MKKLSFLILPLMFVALLSGCEYFFPENGSDEQPMENTIKLNEEFDLKYGQVVVMDEGRIKFHFSSVAEDSRCPERALCVWEGNAMIIVDGYGADGQSGSVMLNTHKGDTARYPHKGNLMGYEVELIALKPYPMGSKPIPHNDYVARLIVRKK